MARISRERARRIALGAQGFADQKPTGRVDVRLFRRVLDRIGLVQLDSVNVFSRSHYLPFLARLGPYDRAALDRWLWSSGELFEYWAHEASVLPMDLYPHAPHSVGAAGWRFARKVRDQDPEFLEKVLKEVRLHGPLQTADLSSPGERREGMWGWSDGKRALEALFVEREVATAARPNFVRLYDVTERVIPEPVRRREMAPESALTELVRRAARFHGVGTVADLADYFRINQTVARPLLERLVESGELEKVEVEGWDRPAYLDPSVTVPRSITGAALLSPFDPVVWYRDRAERLWDFHYRIEIYTPAPQRIYGYYVLPLLLDGHLVGRVDLKTDRKRKRLVVQGAFGEPGIDRWRTALALSAALEETAGWLGMDGVELKPRGDLAAALRRTLA